MRYSGTEFYFKHFNFFKWNEHNRNFSFLFVNYFEDILIPYIYNFEVTKWYVNYIGQKFI